MGALPCFFKEEIMFDYKSNQDYVRAELDDIGINIDDVSIEICVNHGQGDDVSFDCSLAAGELEKSVDLYIEKLIASKAPAHQTGPLKEKLKYFLKVYDSYSANQLQISASKHSSRIEIEHISDDILYDTTVVDEDGNKVGVAKDIYRELMEIDGAVLIARFALKQFFESEVLDFISEVESNISTCLYRAYNTFSEIDMQVFQVSGHTFTRRINDDLSLRISLEESGMTDDISDCYFDEVELSNGKQVYRRNNDLIKSIFKSAVEGKNTYAYLKIDILDSDDCDVYQSWHHTYVERKDSGRIVISELKRYVREAILEFRSSLSDEHSVAA